MFKHLFASMNEMLDEVTSELPAASGKKHTELVDKLRALKAMSDDCIEQWLLFEEKWAALMQAAGVSLFSLDTSDPLDPEFAARRSDDFIRGQGYYKLHMFDKAIAAFSGLIASQPEFTLARIYLAMCYLRKGDATESYPHFHLLSQLTDNLQLRAISYNAMGCIQAQQQNMEKAYELFNLAYRTDPLSVQPLIDLGICSEKRGGLHFSSSGSRTPK